MRRKNEEKTKKNVHIYSHFPMMSQWQTNSGIEGFLDLVKEKNEKRMFRRNIFKKI